MTNSSSPASMCCLQLRLINSTLVCDPSDGNYVQYLLTNWPDQADTSSMHKKLDRSHSTKAVILLNAVEALSEHSSPSLHKLYVGTPIKQLKLLELNPRKQSDSRGSA